MVKKLSVYCVTSMNNFESRCNSSLSSLTISSQSPLTISLFHLCLTLLFLTVEAFMSQNDRPGLLNKISFSKRHLGMEQPRNDEKGGRNIAKGRCVFPRLVILYASQTGT